MPVPAECLISLEEERMLVQRLVDGDPTASSDLARVFLAHLINWLKERNSIRISDDLCVEAAEDAVISLAKAPASFDSDRRLSLAAYLRMSAQADLRNILQREKRQRRNQVELTEEHGNTLQVTADPSLEMQRQEGDGMVARLLAPVRAGLSDGESRVLDLMLDGERKTSVFAAALSATHLPRSEQRRVVKRVKDKLKMRLKREKAGHEPS